MMDYLEKGSWNRNQNSPTPFGARLLRQLLLWSTQLAQWFQASVRPLFRRVDWALTQTIALILAFSFVVASGVSTTAASVLLESALNRKTLQKNLANDSDGDVNLQIAVPSKEEIKNQKKTILIRNIFNPDSAITEEELDDVKSKKSSANLDFTKVSCQQGAQLPVTVLGAIYSGQKATSFVLMKDPKIEETDLYKIGDVLIDYPEYQVFNISPHHVEIRNGDNKYCVEFGKDEQVPGAKKGGTTTETIALTHSYVNAEIGPGYSKILNSAKLIPEADGNTGKTAGFRILSIVPNSIFARIGLQDGDLILQVNDVSFTDPSQGFKLYQALQEDSLVTIALKRNDQTISKKVEIQ